MKMDIELMSRRSSTLSYIHQFCFVPEFHFVILQLLLVSCVQRSTLVEENLFVCPKYSVILRHMNIIVLPWRGRRLGCWSLILDIPKVVMH